VVLVEHPVLYLAVQLSIPQQAEMVLLLTVFQLVVQAVLVQHQTEQLGHKLAIRLL
jgi:hypothetical protein